MNANITTNLGDGRRPLAKQAAVIDDCLYPMPRAKMMARDILDQAGKPAAVLLQRDYNSPLDHVFRDGDEVDLREGNVFKTVPRCEPTSCDTSRAQAKLAFVADDVWAVTVTAQQTGRSLKRLLGLPDNAELFRDLESPQDQPISDDASVLFRDGPVFIAKRLSLKMIVNKKDVHVSKRRLTGIEIKRAAIGQGVNIQESFVLYRIDKEGNLGPAIPDAEIVTLNDCDEFRCVAPDDNS